MKVLITFEFSSKRGGSEPEPENPEILGVLIEIRGPEKIMKKTWISLWISEHNLIKIIAVFNLSFTLRFLEKG